MYHDKKRKTRSNYALFFVEDETTERISTVSQDELELLQSKNGTSFHARGHSHSESHGLMPKHDTVKLARKGLVDVPSRTGNQEQAEALSLKTLIAQGSPSLFVSLW